MIYKLLRLKQFIGLWNLFYLSNYVGCSIDKDQDNFLKNKKDPFLKKCGAVERYQNLEVPSRIINSETVEYLYPWMAYVLHYRMQKVNINGYKTRSKVLGTCTGIFVTETVLLTNGHCICDAPSDPAMIHQCKDNFRYNDTSIPHYHDCKGYDMEDKQY